MWSYNQSRVPCHIFKILSFRTCTCAVNLTDLSSFSSFHGNNKNKDCSPGCLDSPCRLQLCPAHSCVVDFLVFLVARLPENISGKSPQLSSAQWIPFIACRSLEENTSVTCSPFFHLPAEFGSSRLGPTSLTCRSGMAFWLLLMPPW